MSVIAAKYHRSHEFPRFAFLQRNHRLPRLGDTSPPWSYRGWLLPYLVLLHQAVPAVGDRWGYYLRTLEAGKLLDEPIPQIKFAQPDRDVFKRLTEWSGLMGHDCGGWSNFRTLLDWLRWALALGSESPQLGEETHEKLYRQVNLQPLLEQPFDYLGEYVSMHKANGWNPTAFYPTPHPVTELMVQLTRSDTQVNGADSRLKTVMDPCVGSGRMLLHASNITLSLWGQDIDPLAIAMCLINGALYAPWLAFPLPSSIVGMTPNDSLAIANLKGLLPERLRHGRTGDSSQGSLFGI